MVLDFITGFDVGELSEDCPDDFEGLDASAAHIANLLSTEPADSKILYLLRMNCHFQKLIQTLENKVSFFPKVKVPALTLIIYMCLNILEKLSFGVLYCIILSIYSSKRFPFSYARFL